MTHPQIAFLCQEAAPVLNKHEFVSSAQEQSQDDWEALLGETGLVELLALRSRISLRWKHCRTGVARYSVAQID